MGIKFRIYVGSLSDYNNRTLYGTWIDFDDYISADDVRDKIDAMFADSPSAQKSGLNAVEWAIYAYELPGNLNGEEYGGIDELWDCYEVLQELEDDEIEAFFAFFDYVGGKYPLHEDISNFRKSYRG